MYNSQGILQKHGLTTFEWKQNTGTTHQHEIISEDYHNTMMSPALNMLGPE